ncbi:MAG: Ig-like domain-containing protein [Bacteroidaceae bacterium]|nr:Ig-like domain-containing protein [Bacteroidaceae bacterium]
MTDSRNLILLLFLVSLVCACASIGSPDGGPYDETPPYVVRSYPENRAVNADRRRIQIYFNEYIKLENPSEKVIVSPPQKEMPNVRAAGKAVRIDLFDSLQENATYTIDFSDAIEDNNEGNPMGNYTFSFSTGPTIDTMEVSGYVLSADNLEPVKGILVGLFSDSLFKDADADSIFRTRPFERVARTNGSGRFVIKGVANGSYRVFALKDVDGDLVFSQKSEVIAFDTALYSTSSRPDIRLDTVWRDSVRYDSIRAVNYTHFFPDDIVLRSFTEAGQDRHLLKIQRDALDHITAYFTAPVPDDYIPADSANTSTLPRIQGLNFEGDGGFIIEASAKEDTITYWIPDTTLAYNDSVNLAFSYLESDTLHQLYWRTDTLQLVPKVTRARQLEELAEKTAEWEKEQRKMAKKNKNFKPTENPHLNTYLSLQCRPSGTMTPSQNPTLTFSEPVVTPPDSTAFHLYIKEDTLWNPEPFEFLPVDGQPRSYRLYAEWELASQYRFEIDSAAVRGILGHVNRPFKQDFRVGKEDDYGTLYIQIVAPDTGVVVQLLNNGDKPVAQQRADKDGRAEFYYLKPGEYYLRCFIDLNNDEEWTTGDYSTRRFPEETFYFPKEIPVRAGWEIEQKWELRGIAIPKQKPSKITKQKPDKEKKRKERNKDRSAAMKRESKKRRAG